MQKIDLEEVIRTKNPRLLKMLPGFMLSYVKRIIHQDEFNDFLLRTKDLYAHDFVSATLNNFQIHVISEGTENIPENGGCIVVCNHPLGGIDGIAVMKEVGNKRSDIKAMVNDILMNLKNLSSLLIPVNKHAKNAIENIRRIDNAYASDECIIVFPAGLVSRRQNGEIKDLEWKKSFITKAIKYKRNIIPVHIDARNSNFFYNLASLRKKIGIKANIEMFYLVDEVFRQKGKFIKLTIGKPIPYTTFTKMHSDLCWAGKVKEHVYDLGSGKKQLWGGVC
ncbi:MAG: 1-acyl-sn-glycerol-3-phosphate acyltransferase [Bacteroidetes bacterium]|nr:1-acyl-sn-glycerol-3-phosphate acyltransferase [Bacteroidota bacterium]